MKSLKGRYGFYDLHRPISYAFFATKPGAKPLFGLKYDASNPAIVMVNASEGFANVYQTTQPNIDSAVWLAKEFSKASGKNGFFPGVKVKELQGAAMLHQIPHFVTDAVDGEHSWILYNGGDVAKAVYQSGDIQLRGQSDLDGPVTNWESLVKLINAKHKSD